MRREHSKYPLRWHTSDDEPHGAIIDNVTRLLSRSKIADLQRWRRLFTDQQVTAVDHETAGLAEGQRSRHNVIANAVESQTSTHAKDLPRPMILPVGADFKVMRKAVGMQRFVEADWERVGAPTLRQRQVLDACIYGTGIIKIAADHLDETVCWSRVFPGDLLTEPREEKAGKIMTLYEVRAIDRDVLLDRLEEYETEDDEESPRHEKIEAVVASAEPAYRHMGIEDDDTNLIMVVEAWRLPAFKGKHGRHCIVIDGATLEDDREWRGKFPFDILQYQIDPESPMFGIGLPQRMAGLQYEQNELSAVVADNARLLSGKKVLLYNNATLGEDTITNEAGEFIPVNGPVGSVGPFPVEPIDPSVVSYLERQRVAMLEDQGISPLVTSGQMPIGVDSGKAMQVYRNTGQDRHAMFDRRIEQSTKNQCDLHVRALEELVDAGVSPVANVRNRNVLDVVNYNDVRLSENQCQAQTFPISEISRNPSGKFAQLMEMQNAQWLSPVEARRLYNLPDLEESNDIQYAAMDLADDFISKALDGEVLPATRVCDRQYLVAKGWQTHAKYRLAGATDEDLEPLRLLIGSAQTQLDQEAKDAAEAALAMQAAAARQAAPTGAMAPPTASPDMQPQPMPPPGVPGPTVIQ